MKYRGVSFLPNSQVNQDGTFLVFLSYRKRGLNFKYYLKNRTHKEIWPYIKKHQTPPENIFLQVSNNYPVFISSVRLETTNLLDQIHKVAELMAIYEVENKNKGEMFTEYKLKTYLDNSLGRKDIEDANTTIVSFIEAVIEEMKEGRILTPKGSKYRTSTLHRFKQLQSHFKEFQKARNYRLIDIQEEGFVNKFLQHLEKIGLSIETIKKHKKSIVRIVTIAKEKNLISSSFKLKGLYNPKGLKNEAFALTETELQRMWAVEVPTNRAIYKAKDIFYVCCYTGQSISDVFGMSRKDITLDEEGRSYLKIERNKTTKPILLLLKPQVVQILEKYNYNLNIIANGTVNKEIKEIGKMAGLTEVFTLVRKSKKITQEKYKFIVSHSGRYSFASTLYNAGVTIREISQIIGHTDVETTEIYLRLDETEFINRQKELDILN